MFAVSPELAARIQGWIDDELNSDPPPTWPRITCLRDNNALPLQGSQLDMWALQPDGTVLCLDLDSAINRAEPVTNPLSVFALLLAGMRHYPALAEIVPFRKTRLFCCALVRRVWPLLGDPRSRRAVETAERYADGLAEPGELLTAWGEACMVVPAGYAVNYVGRTPAHDAAAAAACAARPDVVPPGAQAPNLPASSGPGVGDLINYVVNSTGAGPKHWRDEEVVQKAMLDCVFGPSRPAAFDPAWRTETAVAVARYIYDERAFGDLPVLADALEDAGCTDPDVLGHCRGGGEHARGCWVVDLALGRS